jgi:ribosome assembly protein 1
VEDTTPDGRCTVRVRVVRLPGGITIVLDDNAKLLRGILTEEGGLNVGRRRGGVDSAGKEEEDSVLVLRERLLSAAAEADAESEGSNAGSGVLDGRGLTWKMLLESVWGSGPRGVGSNLLLVPEVWRPEVERFPGGREEGKEGGGMCGMHGRRALRSVQG